MNITSKEDAVRQIEKLAQNAKLPPRASGGLEGLLQLKFDPMGRDPLEDKDLNWIEQINQTATCLVSFLGVKWLYENVKDLPSTAIFELNLGASNGFDIQCKDPAIYCEVFAAVSGTNNNKLKNDVKRLHFAEHDSTSKLKIKKPSKKYVFCMTANDNQKLPIYDAQKLLGNSHEKLDVTIVRFSRRSDFAVIEITR
jgi:hypothetical protein